MFPTVEDTIYIYARACRAWYKSEAPKVAREKAAELKRKGDEDGARLWRQLEDAIVRMPNPPSSTH